jgi:protein-S-isoprenylcysteine O-methyltransferase Ste14
VTTILLGASILCWTSFGWAILFFFRRNGRTSLAMKANGLFGGVFGLGQLVSIRWGPHGSFAAAIGLFLLSGLLFWWTIGYSWRARQAIAFSDGQALTKLYVDGPYRWVRHPFYVAYALYWAGGLAAAPGVLQMAALGTMSGFYLWAAIAEEKRILGSATAEDYRRYRTRTGMFVPGLRRQPQKPL